MSRVQIIFIHKLYCLYNNIECYEVWYHLKGMLQLVAKRPLFWGIILIKILLMGLFSSQYETTLFKPFIEHYLNHGGNPWQSVWSSQVGLEFPYHPIMLWIVSWTYAPFYYLNQLITIPNVMGIGFQISSLLADCVILHVLCRLFPHKSKDVLLYYFASPIVLYGTYMHGQLDLIPTALLLLSIYRLKRKSIGTAGILMGCAAATKFHTVIAFPILVIYLWKGQTLSRCIKFILTTMGVWGAVVAPYIGTEGFQKMVLLNPKQFLWQDVTVMIGNQGIYLSIVAISVAFLYFLSLRRCNFDLLLAFLGSIFSVLLALTKPEPGWYIWMLPFWVVIIIKNRKSAPNLKGLYFGLTSIYLVYFIGFHQSDYIDLLFLGESILQKSEDIQWIQIVYTLLETGILLSILTLFQYGIRSNELYRKQDALTIGISGDSGVGKTHLLKTLKKMFSDRLVELEGDGEHKWERGDANWDLLTHLDPKANALHKQADYVHSLKYGQAIHRREYDHNTGRFTSLKKVKPQSWVVLSGLHTFYLPRMRKLIDIKVFIDTDETLRRHWKVIRDCKERGKSQEEVIGTINQREKDARKFIQPQKRFSDFIINYYPLSEIKIGDVNDKVKLGLKVTLNANLHIDGLIEMCAHAGYNVDWDYADDLETQSLTFNEPIKPSLLLNFLRQYLPNSHELLDEEIQLPVGYDAIILSLLLLAISSALQTDKK